MKPDHKAAKEWATSWAASIPDSTEKIVAAAYLELEAQLEAERKNSLANHNAARDYKTQLFDEHKADAAIEDELAAAEALRAELEETRK